MTSSVFLHRCCVCGYIMTDGAAEDLDNTPSNGNIFAMQNYSDEYYFILNFQKITFLKRKCKNPRKYLGGNGLSSQSFESKWVCFIYFFIYVLATKTYINTSHVCFMAFLIAHLFLEIRSQFKPKNSKIGFF